MPDSLFGSDPAPVADPAPVNPAPVTDPTPPPSATPGTSTDGPTVPTADSTASNPVVSTAPPVDVPPVDPTIPSTPAPPVDPAPPVVDDPAEEAAEEVAYQHPNRPFWAEAEYRMAIFKQNAQYVYPMLEQRFKALQAISETNPDLRATAEQATLVLDVIVFSGDPFDMEQALRIIQSQAAK